MLSFLRSIPQTLRKLLPTFILLALVYLAGGTDVFSARVRLMVTKIFQDYADKAAPILVNVLIAAIVAIILWLLYTPVLGMVQRVLQKAEVSTKGYTLAIQVLKLVYTMGAFFIVFTFFAPDLSGKFMLGFGVLGAAATLALKDITNDVFSGLMLQFSQKLNIGDEILLVGTEDVKGKIVELGWFSITLQTDDGRVVLPNREAGAKPLKVIGKHR
jgi:small-conductance mechanosensitive channel